MYLPMNEHIDGGMPASCPAYLNPSQRAACLAGECQGQKCLWVGDARIFVPRRYLNISGPVSRPLPVDPLPVHRMASGPAATPAPSSGAVAVGPAGVPATVPVNGPASILGNAWAWLQANPLLAGGLVLGAVLLMHGGRR